MTDRPDWRLERIALDETNAEESGALTEHDLRKLEELKDSNEAILARYPPAGVRAEVERRLRTPAPSQRRLGRPLLWLPAVAAAGAVLALSLDPSDEPDTRLKGGDVRLTVHRKTNAGIEQVRPGDRLAAGDLLQLGYTPGGSGHAVIFSVDGRGAVSLHWPESRRAFAAMLDPGGASLPSAYELDDAPAFERFFLVVCPERFSVSSVLDRAEQLQTENAMNAELEAGADCETSDVLFLKEAS